MLKHQTITFLEKQLCSSFSFAYFLIKYLFFVNVNAAERFKYLFFIAMKIHTIARVVGKQNDFIFSSLVT